MLKSGFILAVGSLLGFLANFSLSILLEKNSFGEIFTLFTLISILSIAAPFGTNLFFVMHRDIYFRHAREIVLFPVLVSVSISLVFLVVSFSFFNLAFAFLLVVSALSIQGIMVGQIRQDGIQVATLQSLQPFIKSIAATAVLVGAVMGVAEQTKLHILAVSLFVSCAIALALVLAWLVGARSSREVSTSFFFREFSVRNWVSLGSFWMSSVLGMAYSFGIIPLVSYFHGYEYSAYLGVYFIFWSGSNVLITMLINNHFWPKCCALRSIDVSDRAVIFESLRASFLLAFLTLAGMVIFALFLSDLFWSEYSGISAFLGILSIAIFFRALSAWLGMMILASDDLISKKFRVQLGMTVVMALAVAAINISSTIELAWIMVSLEVGYFVGYFAYSIRVLREKYFQAL